MKVNTAYRGLDLPVDNWPLLDEFLAPQWYIDQNRCYQNSPTPYLQLVANRSGLGPVSLNLQFANSAIATVCRYDGNDAHHAAAAHRGTPGRRAPLRARPGSRCRPPSATTCARRAADVPDRPGCDPLHRRLPGAPS